jgi:uncharacterized protein (DUF4415 family)
MMPKKKKTKAKITYGTVELEPGTFDPRNVKERVTCMIDEDVVDWLRKEASGLGIGYQTLLNMKLRESMRGSTDDHIRQIVREELRKEGA